LLVANYILHTATVQHHSPSSTLIHWVFLGWQF